MKKGIIVTLWGEYNFGNRLQNYAVQEILKDKGIDALTIKNDPILNSKDKYILRLLKFKLKKVKNKSEESIRTQNFKKFNENINLSKKYFSFFDKIKFKDYDYWVVGSDQVWNPSFGALRDLELLTFVENEKKIALSASFGVSELPESLKPYVGNALKKFKAISVREDVGKEIVEKITNRDDIEVLIDPTMMISIERWDKVSKKPICMCEKKYILKYFLGKLSNEKNQKIQKFAQDNKYEIIDILDPKSPFYDCGPSEFLYLEKNADLVCTDSFHSCVFAFLYNKPFVVFEREGNNVNMNSRIHTLIHKFKLKDRNFRDEIIRENLICDYSEAYKILENERTKMDIFLEKALNEERKDEN